MDANSGHVKVLGSILLQENDVEDLLSAIAITPVSVAVRSRNPMFRHYASGIINKCGVDSN